MTVRLKPSPLIAQQHLHCTTSGSCSKWRLTPIKHLAMLPQQQSWSAPFPRQNPHTRQGLAAWHLWAKEVNSKFICSSPVAPARAMCFRLGWVLFNRHHAGKLDLSKLLQKGKQLSGCYSVGGTIFTHRVPCVPQQLFPGACTDFLLSPYSKPEVQGLERLVVRGYVYIPPHKGVTFVNTKIASIQLLPTLC